MLGGDVFAPLRIGDSRLENKQINAFVLTRVGEPGSSHQVQIRILVLELQWSRRLGISMSEAATPYRSTNAKPLNET